ncbi:MAG: hypothetical protein GX592_07405, partial [Clostridiales bacterium]|nr:hypothetical protein [Clostridiales bacterium]
LGMLRCYELASCCERITAAGIGMEDFTTSMGLRRYYELNSTDLLYARQKMILDCRAAGVQALDSGTLFKGNVEFMRKDSAIDRRHGFNGRSVGDLCQVDAISEVFSPSEQDVSWANRVIAAYGKGMENGDNDVYVDGCFIDPPVVDKAERILAEMRAIKERLSR